LTGADFLTLLATFAEAVLLCFGPEAVARPEETFFFFSSFFFWELDADRVLAAATLTRALLFWRLESVSLIRIPFCEED
jgi:hypothetical protein